MDASEMAPAMALALRANFGSVAQWREAFVATGHGRSAGSVLLAFDPRVGTLVNRWAADPSADALLAVAAPCSDAAMEGIDWQQIYERYQQAVEHASEAFGAAQGEVEGALLLDVRRDSVFEQAEALIPGAEWHDPGDVGAWAAQLPQDRDVIVYCVYGHEVGRATAMRLRAAGVRARYLRGGIDAWQAAHKPLQPKTRGRP